MFFCLESKLLCFRATVPGGALLSFLSKKRKMRAGVERT